jgi:hypothetical protein
MTNQTKKGEPDLTKKRFVENKSFMPLKVLMKCILGKKEFVGWY